MSNALAASNEIVQRSKETLTMDLKAIVSDADKLLRDMASLTSEEVAAARKGIEGKLAEARMRIDDARIVVTRNACSAADATNAYLAENPWKAVGVASLVGVVAALLVFRRPGR